MTISSTQNAVESKAGTKQKSAVGRASAPIRIAQKTKAQLDGLLAQANKDRVGRKIKPDDLICYSLALISDEHIQEVCNKTLSNKDKLEILFKKVSKEKRGISRDEFYGMLLSGTVTGQ